MTHPPTKRRTGMSAVRPPLRRDHHRRDVLLAVGVGFSMVVIAALYAAAFPSMTRLSSAGASDLPRWDELREEVFTEFRPAAEKFVDLRARFRQVVDAKATQTRSIDILKAKIASASATPEAPPETPNP